ncbi:MAG: DUF2828 family protein [Promethearchaeota archaeon]|jgi:hypothetical protein
MFSEAISRYTTAFTTNGAISNKSPDKLDMTSGRLGILFKFVRGISDENLETLLNSSLSEHVIDTFILVFNTRDCRGGKGERSIGRKALCLLAETHPEQLIKVIDLLPEFGRYDDLLQFLLPTSNSCLKDKVLDIIKTQLLNDMDLMNKGESVSLLAKWLPTEGSSIDKKFNLVKTICKHLQISSKKYRTVYITPLRAYINIVERLMCTRKWDEIDYSKVPSNAMKRLKKAFEKNSPCLFAKWKQSLEEGKTEVKGKQLYPHELINEIRLKHTCDVVCEAQWKVIKNNVKELGTFSNALSIIDVSGSMQSGARNALPIDVAISLGMLISELCVGEFNNKFITFSTNPEFIDLGRNTSLFNRFKTISRSNWGMTTDFSKVFQLILNTATLNKLKQEDMPSKLYVISDMQFNIADGNKQTNFDHIDDMYKTHGYTRPQIVFWNVNGSIQDFPVTTDDNGTAMVSGFSPSILKIVMNKTQFNSDTILRDVIDDERYNEIKLRLS